MWKRNLNAAKFFKKTKHLLHARTEIFDWIDQGKMIHKEGLDIEPQ